MQPKDYIENDFLLDIVKSEAKQLYKELKSNRLHVILVPAPYPMHSTHMIRAINGQNPEWYRDIFSRDEAIKRQHSLQALKRISNGDIDLRFKYHRLYLDLIVRRIDSDVL